MNTIQINKLSKLHDGKNIIFSKLDLNWREYVKNDYKFHRPEELHNLKGDSSKLRTTTNWKPEYTFETMMDEMIDTWKQRLS